MASPTYEYKILIREAHLDTFGHVNNATYFQLLEEARWDMITKGGYGLAEVQKRKQGPVLLDAQIKFVHELKLRETITVVTVCDPFKGKVAKIRQEILKEDGRVACEASFTIGFFDLVARKLILPNHDWLKATGIEA